MKKGTISGWFDNETTGARELWCLGEVHRAWPRHVIDSSSDFAPWGSYPTLPSGLADLPISVGEGRACVEKGSSA